MELRIFGKSRRQGISKKSGKPYDFTELHYLARRRGVEGLAAVSKTVDPATIAYDAIELNADYIIEYDESGAIVEMRKADSKPAQGTAGAHKA